ncbi:MAG: hypothetical protein VB115_06555 [Christensenellaceae bacterium]|nr:hypothetical protein [Christensenellaceae bacterium]
MNRLLSMMLLLAALCALPANAQALPGKTELVVANFSEVDEAYTAMAGAHPDIALKPLSSYVSDEQVMTDILSRSDAVDLYCLFVNEPAYKALYERGFLGEADALSPAIGPMLPQVRARIERDGHPVALPVSLSILGSLSYNPAVAAKLGLDEAALPGSWSEFLQFVSDWPRAYAENFPEVALFDDTIDLSTRRELLFYAFYNDYSLHLDQLGGVPSFDTPLFDRLLTAFEAVDRAAFPPSFGGEAFSEGEALFKFGTDVGFVAAREDGNRALGLTLEPGVGPYYGMELNVMILNPYSQKKEAAAAYLEAAARRMDVYTRFNLVPDKAVPTRRADFEEVRRNFETAINELRERAERAEGPDKTDLQLQLADLERRWAVADEHMWTVNAELTALYRAQAPRIVVMRNSTAGGLEGSGDESVHRLIQRYLDGQLDRRAFLAQLDQKVGAMVMEGY